VFSVRSPQIEGRTDSWFNPTGVLGMVWDINDQWTFNSTLGTAWRPAGVNERFSRGIHHGTAQYEVGDPNLKPEKAINTELGVEWDTEDMGFHISVYQSMISDFIQIRPDGDIVSTIRGAFPSYNYVQYDARMRGVEATFHARPTTIYEIMLKGSYLHGQNIDNDEPLYLMPAPSINWIHTLSLPNLEHLRQNTLQGGMRYVFEQMRYPDLVSTDAYREPAPPEAYALFDISASTSLQIGANSLSASLDVRNLLNTRYRDYLSRFRYLVDEPGINIVLRVAYTF
jgi:iron complex outermembrane receptor protein